MCSKNKQQALEFHHLASLLNEAKHPDHSDTHISLPTALGEDFRMALETAGSTPSVMSTACANPAVRLNDYILVEPLTSMDP